jgi:hypothetical protein
MEPRTAGFIQGFLAAPALAGAIYLGVQAWPQGDPGGLKPAGASEVRNALDNAVGRAATVPRCAGSGPGTFVCAADTGHDTVTYRVAVSHQARCWSARATDASWQRHVATPNASDPGTINFDYHGWLRDRADCDHAFKHAQEITAKEAKATALKCTPGYSICIPAGGGDVNCGDLAATNIAVTGSDPYGLDADGDGVGCES